MRISIFLSYPKPITTQQEMFLQKTLSYLENRGLAPRTLGVTDYDMEAPLKAIRRMLLECNGLISIAFGTKFWVSGKAMSGPLSKRKGILLNSTRYRDATCRNFPCSA